MGEADGVNSKGVEVCGSIKSKFDRLEDGLVLVRDDVPEVLEGIDVGPFM